MSTLATASQILEDTAWRLGAMRSHLARALAGQGKNEEAEAEYLKAYETIRLDPLRKKELQRLAERIAQFYEKWGKAEQAAQWRRSVQHSGRQGEIAEAALSFREAHGRWPSSMQELVESPQAPATRLAWIFRVRTPESSSIPLIASRLECFRPPKWPGTGQEWLPRWLRACVEHRDLQDRRGLNSSQRSWTSSKIVL